MFFWNNNNLAASNIFVIINTISQLAYIATRLKPLNKRSGNSWLTHIVSKTFAGIGVLDLLHNTAAAYFVGRQPTSLVKALTGVGFAFAGAVSDTILGACLVYDLVALSVGQSSYNEPWARMLGWFAGGTAVIVGLKSWMLQKRRAEED